MTPYRTVETQYRGYTIAVHCYVDNDMAEPWVEHDGHGVVEGPTGDKRAGWRKLMDTRHGCALWYDIEATTKLARQDGWGLGDEEKGKLARRLDKEVGQLTKGEIIAEAVAQDFQLLKDYCDEKWWWIGYNSTITDPDGREHDGVACWGYESYGTGEDYMVGEAQGTCAWMVDQMIDRKAVAAKVRDELDALTQEAQNWP